MKQNLSSFEIGLLINDLKILYKARVVNIFQPNKHQLILECHLPTIGKIKVSILVPNFIYLSSFRPSAGKPSNFSMRLRRLLKGAKIMAIKQPDFERIVEIEFNNGRTLIAELFSKGNMIVIEKKILAVLESQYWSYRSLKVGEEYKLPPPRLNPFTLSEAEIGDALKSSRMESVVKAFAVDFGLGGTYAEELCLRANIDKNLPPKEAAGRSEELLNALNSLGDEAPNPGKYLKGGMVIDVCPFKLKKFNGMVFEPAKSFSSALDEELTGRIKESIREESLASQSLRVAELQRVLSEQKSSFSKLEKSIEANKRKGELIFEKYSDVKRLLDEVSQLKKLPLKLRKKKIVSIKNVKDFEPRTGKIAAEI